jgi:hypothetical protein
LQCRAAEAATQGLRLNRECGIWNREGRISVFGRAGALRRPGRRRDRTTDETTAQRSAASLPVDC